MPLVFAPTQQNWRWMEDNAAEPTVALAAENTVPLRADLGSKLRLRGTLAAITGGTAATVGLQFSTDNATWTTLNTTTTPLIYANGQATAGNATTTFLTTDGTFQGVYHEDGTVNETINTGDFRETDFCIAPNNPIPGQAYFLRYIRSTATEIPLGATKTHPQIIFGWRPLPRKNESPRDEPIPPDVRPGFSAAIYAVEVPWVPWHRFDVPIQVLEVSDRPRLFPVALFPDTSWMPFKTRREPRIEPEVVILPGQAIPTAILPDTSWRPLARKGEPLPTVELIPEPLPKFDIALLTTLTSPWQPWGKRQAPAPPEPPLPESQPRFDIASIFTDTNATVWFPFRQYWRAESFMRPEEKILWSVARFPTGTFPIPFRLGPGIIPWDEDAAHVRYRRHERAVSEILNSLVFQEMLGATAAGVWQTGYDASNPLHWQSNPPGTVKEALDRIAALLLILAGQGA